MADVPNIDPDFEPQSRPRSCTWPMKRPMIANESENIHENGISIKLEPTIEEVGSEEQLMIDDGMSPPNISLADLNPESDDSLLMSGAYTVSDYRNGLIKSPAANCVTDYTSSLTSPQPMSTVTASDISDNNPSFINLDPAPHSNTVTLCNYGAVTVGENTQNTVDTKPIYLNENMTSPGHLQNMRIHSLPTNEDSISTTSPALTKPKSSSRKNAWGNMSYADLITQGIESSPDKRLTLAQIYDWMVKNVPYFKDKGDSNSSAGWKNSIRHNLSLHAKFKRVQNEGTGKSSWWVINHDAKPGKPNRRRTTSLDASNPKFKQSRAKAMGKKSDLPKKQKSSSKKDTPPTWAKSVPSQEGPLDYEHPMNKPLLSDYRPRTSSNASSIGGRITPRNLLPQDLEDDGPPPLSPLSSSSYAAPTSSMDLLGRTDPFNLVGDMDRMQSTGELLESINIDMVASSPMSQSNNEKTNIYLNSTQNNKLPCPSPRYIQQLNGVTGSISSQQQQLPAAAAANPNNGVLSSPNLASLLQQGTNNQQTKYQTINSTAMSQNKRLPSVDINNSVPRARANTMPKLQPQPKYNMSDTTLRRQQSGESLMQGTFYPAYRSPESQQQLPSPPESTYMHYQYGQNQSTQPRPQLQDGFSSLTNQNKTLFQLLGQPRSDNVTAASQAQQLNINRSNSMSVADQQRNCDGSLMLQSYSVPQQNSSNDLTSLGSDPKYPTDLSSIDNQDMFDPGTFDIEEMLQDITPGIDRFGSEFNSYFPQGSFEAPETDNSMDASNTLTPTNSTSSMGKIVESSESNYSYPPNQQISSDSPFGSQHRYPQPVNVYSMSEGGDAQLLLGANRPSNGRMLITRSGPTVGITSSGLSSPFAHPHQMLRFQSSVGAVSDYRM